jgi:hypothetical protein
MWTANQKDSFSGPASNQVAIHVPKGALHGVYPNT